MGFARLAAKIDMNPLPVVVGMEFFFWLALITLAALITFGIDGILGARRIRRLDDIPPEMNGRWPSVSIIIPALNEEENIEEALGSVLALDYEPLEIIVVNDRSTDATGAILERMARQYPRLIVLHIDHLPSGWLGKSHALHCGAERADGELLLFTDADVTLEPSTLKRAVAAMGRDRLDHLTLFFRALLPSSLLRMVVLEFGVVLVAFLRPWRVRHPASGRFIGIGAFNLVRAAGYRRAGGHLPIRLCPLDDIMLGRLLKSRGLRQDCLYGARFVTVPWYASLREMTSGLMKNTFAALDYSITRLFLLTLLQLAGSIWPVWALVLTHGQTRLINGAIVLLQGTFFVIAARYSGMEGRDVLWFPVTPYLRLAMAWKAVLVTLWRGGIVWRGTFYSLEELKQGRFSGRP